ncbi:hypothetical protein CERSUDRAFT_79996 [Gelatoporia subvermispora B]|uniref:Thioesterase domain-containing protein n=1 Tax=Ceriporiopsis subvermispora (strain B) TaxID=914234 RepID=M2RPF9_CERS8|nr:hypothetical protein CERSUDRAFT_79996 [Gelatoporia subvermispora B]
MDYRQLPSAPAPNDRPDDIKGNLSLEQRQHAVNILAFHVAHHPDSRVFGHDVAKGLELVEAWVKPVMMGAQSDSVDVSANQQHEQESGTALRGRTICEILVEEGMLNVHRSLAGACAVLLLDIATFSSLFVLSLVSGVDAWGVSTAMNITWHAPAGRGTKLRFVSTTLSLGGRLSAARCEIYDAQSARLLISAVHTISPLKTLSSSHRTVKPVRSLQSKL